MAFLQPVDVVPTFELLCEDERVPADFISYFEYAYIGISRGRGNRIRRDKPLFPVKLWNVRERLFNDSPKSNNSVEGFHQALKSSITSMHPKIWKLCNDLKLELDLSESNIIQRNRGDPYQEKIYAMMDIRIKNQLTRYDSGADMNALELLRNLANVMEF